MPEILTTTDKQHVYTEAEAKAFDEGREAYRNGRDYFESPYMTARPRDLYLITAYSEGWMAAEAERR